MSSLPKINRYEIKEILGEGGMGIVYRAVDRDLKRDVALKTIKELLDLQQIDAFLRECDVLKKLEHPNIVNLYDAGVSEDNGEQKPFFVMPFLPGATLDRLIRNQAARLTPDRVVDIVTQTARGLQAAHDTGLIHRDVKPSNIFVLSDDSVKLIDFGIAHLADQRSRTGFKGTLPYMSPEQWESNPPTTVSDVFSLAVVCYEALVRRRPFNGTTESEIREAILHLMPPPVSELNPAVSLALSQVVHAAMAKQPWNRTSSARQFAEELQKALHGQAIERFDPSRIEPRIGRAQKALETSEYDFASEIVAEIEAEGHINPTIRSLRRQIDQALRGKTVKQALDSARHRFAEGEYRLALQKVDEVLRLDPNNLDALALKNEADNTQKTQQIENWFRHAQDHLKHYAFNHARQALQNVLRLKPTNTMALQMIAEVDRRENEYLREHREKEQLYKAALEAWQRGEVSVAFSKLERVLDLDRRAPDSASSESAASYQNLYEQVRSEHDRINNAYQEARKLLSENGFDAASSICEQVLAKYSDHTLFQALKEDIGERQRQYVSSYVIKIDQDVEAEPDLDRKVAILSEALRLYPEEAHFIERLDKVARRRDLVAGIKQKVDNLEERGQYIEALGQLEILRAIYPQYRGMDLEVDRISRRRDQQSKADTKTRWVNETDAALNAGDFAHALILVKSALADFPDDAELIAQERLASDGLDHATEAIHVFERANAQCAKGDLKGSLDGLWQAYRLDERNPLIQAVLVETLLKLASKELDADPRFSEQLVVKAIELDPGNRQAVNLQRLILDRQKDKAVDLILSRSREVQAAEDVNSALIVVEQGLDSHPNERRLRARKEALLKMVGPAKRPDEKEEKEIDNSPTPRGKRLHEVEESNGDFARTPPAEDDRAVSSGRRTKRLAIFSTIAIGIILIGSIAAYKAFRRPKSVPVLIEAEVAIDASVPGARILVDDKDVGAAPVTLRLPEGPHSIDAAVPGYASKEPVAFRVGGGAPSPPSTVTVSLEPLPTVVRVSTEFRQASLDNQKLMLDGTGFERSDLQNGLHVLQLSSPVAGTITVEFELNPGQTPVVHKIESTRTLVVALAALKERGQLHSSSKALKIALNGAEAQPIGEQSAPLNLLSGRNVLALDDSKNPITVSVDANANPGLTIFVGAQPNVGSLEVTEISRLDATVSVEPADKKNPPRTQTLKNGKTTFSGLEPKAYLVEISSAGYETVRMSVPVVKGDVANAAVSLKALPTTATLLIINGTADAEIFLDNNPIGKLNSAGFFSYQISPGKHRIQLRKTDYEDTASTELEVTAGGTTRLSGPDVVLKPYGWIEFNVNPPNSTITYRSLGGIAAPGTAKNGDMPHLRAGRYSISVAANGYQPYTDDSFDVESGKGKPFNRTLVPTLTTGRRNAPTPPIVVVGKEGLDAPNGDVAFSLFRQRIPGTYSFRIKLRRPTLGLGKRAKWVVNFIDSKNYIEYEIDDKSLKYTTHNQNAKDQSKSVQHRISAPDDFYELTVSVSMNEITLSIGAQRIPLETPASVGNFLVGSFGFPKDENVDLNTFRFTGTPAR